MKHKFESGDLFYNTLRANPRFNFILYESQIYLNNDFRESGSFANPILGVPNGYVSLHELNVDRNVRKIYPYVTKDGVSRHFKNVSTGSFNNDFQYGDIISGSYEMSASIAVEVLPLNSTRTRVNALQNILNDHRIYNPNYAYNSTIGDEVNKGVQPMSLVSIPEILYGDSIKKGSVKLRFYLSGTMTAELTDAYRNGDLVETGRGLLGGVVLYKEGEILVTGSWDLHATHTEDYQGTGAESPKWWLFGSNLDNSAEYSAFELEYEGVHRIPNVSMFCHAKAGDIVHSNNPTYIQYSQSLPAISSSGQFIENSKIVVKNTVKSVYNDPDADFEKQTWISKIVIYDENGTAIGVAKLAEPVRKTLARDLTFRLSLDV